MKNAAADAFVADYCLLSIFIGKRTMIMHVLLPGRPAAAALGRGRRNAILHDVSTVCVYIA